MRGTLVLAALIAALLGCGDDEVDTSVTRGPGTTRGVPPGGPAPGAPPPTSGAGPGAPGAARRAPPPPARPPRPTTEGGGWLVGPIEETREAPETTPGTPPARDLEAELRRALGVPHDCFPEAVLASAGAALHVPVQVVVTSGGRVTRADVGGSLPDAVRTCIRQRAEAVAIAPPVERAPRTISAELVIEVQRTGGEAPPPVPERRLPPGTQAPGLTLPAVGAQGRPEGFVAPDTTLPAVGAEGRPPGFVPPDRTLPARAP